MQVWKPGGNLVACVVTAWEDIEECGVRCSLHGLVLQPDTQKCFVETKYISFKEIFHSMYPQRIRLDHCPIHSISHSSGYKMYPHFASSQGMKIQCKIAGTDRRCMRSP